MGSLNHFCYLHNSSDQGCGVGVGEIFRNGVGVEVGISKKIGVGFGISEKLGVGVEVGVGVFQT